MPSFATGASGAGAGVPTVPAGAAGASGAADPALAGAADDVVVPVNAGTGAGAGAGAAPDGGARGVPPNLQRANENNHVWDSRRQPMLGRTKTYFV